MPISAKFTIFMAFMIFRKHLKIPTANLRSTLELTPCCNSYVFEGMRPKFVTGILRDKVNLVRQEKSGLNE